jgi:hypothetical protein
MWCCVYSFNVSFSVRDNYHQMLKWPSRIHEYILRHLHFSDLIIKGLKNAFSLFLLVCFRTVICGDNRYCNSYKLGQEKIYSNRCYDPQHWRSVCCLGSIGIHELVVMDVDVSSHQATNKTVATIEQLPIMIFIYSTVFIITISDGNVTRPMIRK